MISHREKGLVEFYMNRNAQLSEWIENPTLVPRLLWPQAMKLALEAGEVTLFCCLKALSGHAIDCW